eukprot:2625087-Pleurochrysis_carterae.AAC.2
MCARVHAHASTRACVRVSRVRSRVAARLGECATSTPSKCSAAVQRGKHCVNARRISSHCATIERACDVATTTRQAAASTLAPLPTQSNALACPAIPSAPLPAAALHGPGNAWIGRQP